MNKLRELRLAAALTQKELADKAGVDLSTVSQLELNNGKTARELTLAKLAKALGVEYEVLAYLATPPEVLSKRGKKAAAASNASPKRTGSGSGSTNSSLTHSTAPAPSSAEVEVEGDNPS